jgi:hypothetical protein
MIIAGLTNGARPLFGHRFGRRYVFAQVCSRSVMSCDCHTWTDGPAAEAARSELQACPTTPRRLVAPSTEPSSCIYQPTPARLAGTRRPPRRGGNGLRADRSGALQKDRRPVENSAAPIPRHAEWRTGPIIAKPDQVAATGTVLARPRLPVADHDVCNRPDDKPLGRRVSAVLTCGLSTGRVRRSLRRR